MKLELDTELEFIIEESSIVLENIYARSRENTDISRLAFFASGKAASLVRTLKELRDSMRIA